MAIVSTKRRNKFAMNCVRRKKPQMRKAKNYQLCDWNDYTSDSIYRLWAAPIWWRNARVFATIPGHQHVVLISLIELVWVNAFEACIFCSQMGECVRESVQWPYQIRDTFIYLYLQHSERVLLRTKRIPAPNNRISNFFLHALMLGAKHSIRFRCCSETLLFVNQPLI